MQQRKQISKKTEIKKLNNELNGYSTFVLFEYFFFLYRDCLRAVKYIMNGYDFTINSFFFNTE